MTMHRKREVCVEEDVSDNDLGGATIKIDMKTIIDKKALVYTTRLEEMPLFLQNRKVTLQSIEEASKLSSKQLKQIGVKVESSCHQKCSYEELLEKINMNQESSSRPIFSNQDFLLCAPWTVNLIDYRRHPVLNKDELRLWDQIRKLPNNTSTKIDHVVRMVHIRSGFTQIYHMSAHGILKVENIKTGHTKLIPNSFEIKVCCWYSKVKYLRELYLQQEEGFQIGKSSDNLIKWRNDKKYLGLSHYLRHYVTLCGRHECSPDQCTCCKKCEKQLCFHNCNVEQERSKSIPINNEEKNYESYNNMNLSDITSDNDHTRTPSYFAIPIQRNDRNVTIPIIDLTDSESDNKLNKRVNIRPKTIHEMAPKSANDKTDSKSDHEEIKKVIIRPVSPKTVHKTPPKTLINKALAYDYHKHVTKKDKQKVTTELQAGKCLKNILLEIQNVTYENGNNTLMTINNVQLLKIGPNGNIEMYIRKNGSECITQEVADDCDNVNEKVIHKVCCWNKLQQIIKTLKAQNANPEIISFIRQRHRCPFKYCFCCCSCRPIKILEISNLKKKKNKPKPKISVKPISLLVEEAVSRTKGQKPRRRAVKRPLDGESKSIFVLTRKGDVEEHNSQCVDSNCNLPAPPIDLTNDNVTQLSPALMNQPRDVINVRPILVPENAPLNGCELNSTLMQSIIDEEITRLINEKNGMVQGNRYDRPVPKLNMETMLEIKTTSNSHEAPQEQVPPALEVNHYINQILHKFQDLRITVTEEGIVKAIISQPPDTPEDVILLKNILQQIQACLDQQVGTNQPLANISHMQQLSPAAPIEGTHVIAEAINKNPGGAAQTLTSMSVPLYSNRQKQTQMGAISLTQAPLPPLVPFDYIIPVIQRNETPNSDAHLIPGDPNTINTEESTSQLRNILMRAPAPPNFSATHPIVQNDQDGLEGSFSCWYRTPADHCLDNIKIAKVESMAVTPVKDSDQNKSKKIVRRKPKCDQNQSNEEPKVKRKPKSDRKTCKDESKKQMKFNEVNPSHTNQRKWKIMEMKGSLSNTSSGTLAKVSGSSNKRTAISRRGTGSSSSPKSNIDQEMATMLQGLQVDQLIESSNRDLPTDSEKSIELKQESEIILGD